MSTGQPRKAVDPTPARRGGAVRPTVAAAGEQPAPPVPRVVLVTGVARYLGAQVAARLAADPRIERVIGLDIRPPRTELARLLADTVEVVRGDLAGTVPLGIMQDEGVEAVVHVAIASAADAPTTARSALKEQNVIGTMHLLAACQRSPRLRKVVCRSSTAAYGASFRDPAVFTEETEALAVPRGGFARDTLDIEAYVRGFRRRRPEVSATVLRFAPFIGSRADTTLTRYFARPVAPTVFGRDPRLQFIHVDDALEILYRSVVEEHPGTFNVAGPGVITLSQAIRRAGRLALPILEPGLSALAGVMKGVGLADFSLDQLDLFVHGRVVDVSRLTRAFGVTPRSTVEAFDDFLSGLPDIQLMLPTSVSGLLGLQNRLVALLRPRTGDVIGGAAGTGTAAGAAPAAGARSTAAGARPTAAGDHGAANGAANGTAKGPGLRAVPRAPAAVNGAVPKVNGVRLAPARVAAAREATPTSRNGHGVRKASPPPRASR